MSLRWGTDDAALAGGMSLEGAAADTDLTRAALDEEEKQKKLAAIRADRARKVAALRAQKEMRDKHIQNVIETGVQAGGMALTAGAKTAAKKAGTLEGMKGRLVELEGVEGVKAVGDVKAVPAVEGDIAKLGEGKGWFGLTESKRKKLTAEATNLRQQIAFAQANPEYHAYMQGQKRGN